MLVFLPGQDDIESLQQLLEDNLPFVTGKKSADSANTKSNVVSETVYSAEKNKVVAPPTPASDGGAGLVQSSESTASGGVITEIDADQGSVTVTLLQDFEILPLYAAMPPDEQLKVFTPMKPGVRRFILSTNIAETSVTISGMKYGTLIALLLLHWYFVMFLWSMSSPILMGVFCVLCCAVCWC